MTRAVVDLNIIVSALISPRGAPARVVALWRQGAFALVLSAPMLQTLQEVLGRPRLRRQFIAPHEAAHLMHDVEALAVVMPGDIAVTGAVRDPDDDEVLAAAVEGSVDCIVSGDRDLLALGSYEGIAIIGPTALIEIVEAEQPGPMPRRAYLALGTNLGDREGYLREAMARLGAAPGVNFRRASRVYETEPVGPQDQPRYLNMVVEVEVAEGVMARDLLGAAKRVEAELGRQHRERWGSREIDIDVLLVGEERVKEDDFEVPHPRMWERAFVVVPLADLAPEMMAPTGATVAQLAEKWRTGHGVNCHAEAP